LNASPDVRDQIHDLAGAPASGAVRMTPFEGVVFTDAELDHTLGLMLLREAGRLSVYATPAVESVLTCDSRILQTTRAFSDVDVTHLDLDRAVPLVNSDGSPSGLRVEAFRVAADPPRFAPRATGGHTVGLLISEDATGATCAFVPGCGALATDVVSRLSRAGAVLFDGTFWADDELIALGVGTRTARQLDHVPISGPDGSLGCLAGLPAAHRIYTHVNNTNPVLIEDSAERAIVSRAGLVVGYDGLRIRL
jgi:pyrroloquinoline quinone biosynthesis protein B